MSRSQYMGFVYECEAKEMAKLSMGWVDVPTTAQEVGQYVHSWSAGTQEEFYRGEIFKWHGSNQIKNSPGIPRR